MCSTFYPCGLSVEFYTIEVRMVTFEHLCSHEPEVMSPRRTNLTGWGIHSASFALNCSSLQGLNNPVIPCLRRRGTDGGDPSLPIGFGFALRDLDADLPLQNESDILRDCHIDRLEGDL